MAHVKNVALVGASGTLGAPVLKALLAAPQFNVTVISRSNSEATFPSTVKVVTTDFDSVESLTNALNGQDAVVSTVGNDGIIGQKLLFDAALAAGVKHFLPSEFGGDLSNPKSAKLAVFGYKLAVRQYIEEKVEAGAPIAYTYLVTGAFLDWGLEMSFLLNWRGGKPEIYNGGDQLISATLLESIGTAVVAALSSPAAIRNRTVRVQDIQISQNKLLELAKKVDSGRKWEPVAVDLNDVEKAASASLAKGDYSFGVMFELLKLSLFAEGYGMPLADENDVIGFPGQKTEADVEAIWKELLL